MYVYKFGRKLFCRRMWTRKVLNAITNVFIVRFSFLWVSLLNAYLQSATYFNVLIAAFLFLFGVCLPCI